MTLRRAHGRAAELGALVVVEGCPVDELPAGVPDQNPCPQPGRNRRGQFVAGDPRTKAAASAAGRAKRDRTALAHTLGVSSDDPVWKDALKKADAFRKMQVRILASTVGGGKCGPAQLPWWAVLLELSRPASWPTARATLRRGPASATL